MVGEDRHTLADEDVEVIGVEVRRAEVGDQALGLQRREFAGGVEIGEVLEGPPVELQQVDAGDSEPGPRPADAGPHDVGRHGAGLRAPFREGAGSRGPGRHGARQQAARYHFGAAIMVGHVEGVEARRRIGGERVGAALRIERSAGALLVGDLPQSGDDARDRPVGGEGDAGQRGHGRQAPGGLAHWPAILALRALTASVLISPVVVTLPSVIFHRRNGPVMSPNSSKLTGPMTPS